MKSSGSGVGCSLRRGALGWPQEIQKRNYWSAFRILDSLGFQRAAMAGRNCSRECRYGAQPEFSMAVKTYPCCKETSDSVVYSALAVQNHKQHIQMSFQHRLESDAVSLGKINPTWGSQSSHRLWSPLASDTNSILHIYYYYCYYIYFKIPNVCGDFLRVKLWQNTQPKQLKGEKMFSITPLLLFL